MTPGAATLQGRSIHPGSAEGEALVSRMGISFFGGVDPETGTVVEKGHDLEGKRVTGKVLGLPDRQGFHGRLLHPVPDEESRHGARRHP